MAYENLKSAIKQVNKNKIGNQEITGYYFDKMSLLNVVDNIPEVCCPRRE